jgi:hypothetical protein
MFCEFERDMKEPVTSKLWLSVMANFPVTMKVTVDYGSRCNAILSFIPAL